jgi:hypothetical protein
MSSVARLAALAAFSVFALGARAETFDFNNYATDNYMDMIPSISVDGFDFTNDCTHPGECFSVWNRDFAWQADPGQAAMIVSYGFTTTTLARTDGNPFTFLSIDLADVYNQGTPSSFAFTFHYEGGGSSTQAVTLDTLPGLQTFLFNQHDVTSVSWVTTDLDRGWGQFDNVSVQAVPEPQTFALMGAGLLAMVSLGRRRGRR